jgi:hypothetical protein
MHVRNPKPTRASQICGRTVPDGSYRQRRKKRFQTEPVANEVFIGAGRKQVGAGS